MIENINLKDFEKKSGIYYFESNNEVIYVGSSNSLYNRLASYKTCIKKKSNYGSQADLYQFLTNNPFTIHFAYCDNYREEEQKLIEKYNPKYNNRKAFAGVGMRKDREIEYRKEYHQKYKEEISKKRKPYFKQYYDSHKEEHLKAQKKYNEVHKEEIKQWHKQHRSQKCFYNGETLTLCALKMRLQRKGIEHPTIEAKKYLIK